MMASNPFPIFLEEWPGGVQSEAREQDVCKHSLMLESWPVGR